MKKTIIAALLCAGLPLCAQAANDKIDPETYICAELVATATDTEPPLFEGLQLDGYAAGLEGQPVADALTIQQILLPAYDSCTAKPTEKALAHWRELRRRNPASPGGAWRADKTTCADYYANEEDGSGFVIWLDGYQRAKNKSKKSVFTDQPTLDKFLEICKKNGQRLMIDVMTENAK